MSTKPSSSVDKWATVEATPYYSIGYLPPGKGHSTCNELYHGMSKRVCRKYISYRTGNQGHCVLRNERKR